MAVKKVGGHGVSTVSGHHNVQAVAAHPVFTDAPQASDKHPGGAALAFNQGQKKNSPPAEKKSKLL